MRFVDRTSIHIDANLGMRLKSEPTHTHTLIFKPAVDSMTRSLSHGDGCSYL